MEIINTTITKQIVTLPKPNCTYADHSYPAYTEKQVKELLEGLGYIVRTRNCLGEDV